MGVAPQWAWFDQMGMRRCTYDEFTTEWPAFKVRPIGSGLSPDPGKGGYDVFYWLLRRGILYEFDYNHVVIHHGMDDALKAAHAEWLLTNGRADV